VHSTINVSFPKQQGLNVAVERVAKHDYFGVPGFKTGPDYGHMDWIFSGFLRTFRQSLGHSLKEALTR
jgi:hypothetical protein